MLKGPGSHSLLLKRFCKPSSTAMAWRIPLSASQYGAWMLHPSPAFCATSFSTHRNVPMTAGPSIATSEVDHGGPAVSARVVPGDCPGAAHAKLQQQPAFCRHLAFEPDFPANCSSCKHPAGVAHATGLCLTPPALDGRPWQCVPVAEATMQLERGKRITWRHRNFSSALGMQSATTVYASSHTQRRSGMI